MFSEERKGKKKYREINETEKQSPVRGRARGNRENWTGAVKGGVSKPGSLVKEKDMT